MVLNKLLRAKRKEIEGAKKKLPLDELKKRLIPRKGGRFQSALRRQNGLHLICELKKASPSAGTLKRNFNPVALAKTFERAGATAISVLTEQNYFKGNPKFLFQLKQQTRLPLLRKDFIIDSYQLYESAFLRADAVLLMVMLLKGKKLGQMIRLAKALRLDALVEVHTKDELKRAVRAGAGLIGINNRNLKTLKVNPWSAVKLIPFLPKKAVAVVESGIETRGQIEFYRMLGIRNFLIGTTLMRSQNIAAKIRELKGKTNGK